MKSRRRKFTKDFKAKVALEAIKGQRPLNELAQEFGAPIHWGLTPRGERRRREEGGGGVLG